MIFKQSNRTDAEQVFIVCRNITGATVSAGVPVQYDVVTSTDGNAVTACKSAANAPAGLFAGITDASMVDSAYGLIQVYGFRTSAFVSAASADTLVPGPFLQGTSAGGGNLEPMTTSAATTSGWVFVSLMETITTSSAVASRNVLIRAL
mgnify:CR=1 FL=1